MTKNLTCISCPIGCYLTVTMEEGEVKTVTGNTCKRGITYAQNECTNPLRVVTSTVKIQSKHLRMVPVKTQNPIPKEKIFDCLRAMKSIELKAPITVGSVILEDVCGSGINVVATRDILE